MKGDTSWRSECAKKSWEIRRARVEQQMSKKKACFYCGKVFIPKLHANNIKFCSVLCRNKNYYRKYNRKEKQREYNQKKLLVRFSKNELVQCQICKHWFRQVGSHIWQKYGITAREYREQFGFDVKKGQLPNDYCELKAEQAFKDGGVKNLEQGKQFWFKKGQAGVGVYTRSKQTQERLKQQWQVYCRKTKKEDTGQ